MKVLIRILLLGALLCGTISFLQASKAVAKQHAQSGSEAQKNAAESASSTTSSSVANRRAEIVKNLKKLGIDLEEKDRNSFRDKALRWAATAKRIKDYDEEFKKQLNELEPNLKVYAHATGDEKELITQKY
jgi:hypothetical protein